MVMICRLDELTSCEWNSSSWSWRKHSKWHVWKHVDVCSGWKFTIQLGSCAVLVGSICEPRIGSSYLGMQRKCGWRWPGVGGCTRFVLTLWCCSVTGRLSWDLKDVIQWIRLCTSYFIVKKRWLHAYSDLQSFYFAFLRIEAFHQVLSCAYTEWHWFHCRQPCCYVHLLSQQDKSAE